ncbi:thioredoxin domain-containing protein [Irregularibacter muris]|uniref:thioredoxin domain-containing protein n=1 Tax=Irregularibacter muris TaxID=1796619 RepID=UPI0027D47CC2|nr:thioredoxin domain-containing protein [Irregularibacter muris]
MQGKKESKSNRLIHEKSPYLLQHAHNPVDWYPWGEEAFEKATREDKPIFLSIGYSTCHWCHVMERESFEDEEVAKILHDHFVAIKVDREERPDLDHIYMTFCQAITGQGGWPLTVFLTPDQKPFYAGTYFPKQDMGSRIGLVTLLNKIKELWQTKRDELLSTSSENTKSIQDHIDNVDHQDIEKYVVEETLGYFKENFDEIYGGFGFAPKFPTPHNLRFLLRCWKENKEEEVLNMVEKTLQSMYAGGIYDHIGYGFSRYSTDGEWLVPHFEKMLYDNALLAITYLETYQVTSNPLYAQVAEEIFTYILRDMSHPDGGFYSAEDADSEGVEGKFYVWSKEEITNILGEKEGEEFCKLFDITTYGNFEGKNIPNLIDYGLSHPKDQGKIQQWKEKLFEYREKRIHPHKDDKILTSWNGMMIAALAMGGKVLKKDEYISAAEKSIHFILKNLRDERGRLYARFREGERAYLGYLDDYAYIVWALTELYDATYNFDYIQLAKEINGQMIELFWDEEKGGLFFNGKDAESLLFRPKDIFDGAMPSGNSVATLNFLKLA